jgi:lipopolysaccharide/colanic/teichoic acid biosynthesis glycosyltransferase
MKEEGNMASDVFKSKYNWVSKRIKVAGVPARKQFCKRALDLSMVLITSPLWLAGFVIAAIWIKMVSKGSIFFNQARVGLDGEEFIIFKFRTMKEGADTGVHEDHLKQLINSNKPMKKLDGADTRLIRGGRLIRATGLDELPQIINVILGNMSLVGPRPCTPNELEKCKPPFMRRFRGLPGITGSWQVNGKNDTTFRRMIALDVLYLRKISVRQDLWIMVRTFPTICKQIGELIKSKRGQRVAGKVDLRPQMHAPRPLSSIVSRVIESPPSPADTCPGD